MKQAAEHNGTDFGYVVEMRAAGEKPIDAGGKIIYPEWERAEFAPAKVGVPTQLKDDPSRFLKEMHGKMSYQAARALAMWIHADLGESVRTRLRKYRIEFAHKLFDEGWISECDGSEDKTEPKQDPEVKHYVFDSAKLDLEMWREAGWEPTALGTGAARSGSPTKGRERNPRKARPKATPKKK